MKIRTGYASNSSSSSFIIKMDELNEYQIHQIENHIKFANELTGSLYLCGCQNDEDAWYITEEGMYLKGSTYMDNFDMREFLKLINISDDIVQWDY